MLELTWKKDVVYGILVKWTKLNILVYVHVAC